jgi:hypothetical protein
VRLALDEWGFGANGAADANATAAAFADFAAVAWIAGDWLTFDAC